MPLKIYTEEEVKIIRENDPQLQQFHRITAAGGVVINGNGDILFIFRKGKWDLPKGKQENGEPLDRCAERETMEETGITQLSLQRFLITTYHTYVEKKQLILKDTHWYLFSAPGEPELTPQTDENILKAVWVKPSDMEAYKANTYLLILDVLQEAGL